MAEWYVDPAIALLKGQHTRRLDCAPGQSCDADGSAVDNQCTFRLAVCLNNSDPRLLCTPTSVASYQLLRPNTASLSSDATDRQNAATILGALAALPGATMSGQVVTFAPALGAANVCTAAFDVVVPLKQTRLGGWRLGGRTIRAVIANATAGSTVKDRDSISLRCHPPATPTP